MKPRFSLLNALLLTTIVALVIVVFRLRDEVGAERSLRLQQLQHGGILEVTDLNAVHIVRVWTEGERNTHRWRIYVPMGRSVTLNSRLEPIPANKGSVPRLPTNAPIVGDRSPSNPLKIG